MHAPPPSTNPPPPSSSTHSPPPATGAPSAPAPPTTPATTPAPPTPATSPARPLAAVTTRELALAALAIGVSFAAAFILPLPFWSAAPAAPPPSDQPAPSDLGWPAALLALGFAAALCLPFRPYVLALRALDRAPVPSTSGRALVGLTACVALVALLVYPAFGSDLLVYIDYARLWTVYGANPLLASAALHPEDWAARFVWIPEQPNPYGPLWPILTWPIARLGGDGLWGWIVGYKLLALVSYVTCCALIWRGVEPARRARALLLFAWSPLVLLELLGKVHNDGLLAVSALGGVLLAPRRPALGLLSAALGMLSKLSNAAVVLALGLDLLLRRRALRPFALGLAVVLGLALLLYAPFWQGPASIFTSIAFQTSRVVWSPGALLLAVIGPGTPAAEPLVRLLAAAGWLVAVALLGRRMRRHPIPPSVATLATDAALLLLATLLLLTTAFFAHYLVPLVALAAVSRNRRLEALTLALSIGSLATYAVELLAPALSPGWIGSRGYQALGSLLTLGPALLTLAQPYVSAGRRLPVRLLRGG